MKEVKHKFGRGLSIRFRECRDMTEEFMHELKLEGKNSQNKMSIFGNFRLRHKYVCKVTAPAHLVNEFTRQYGLKAIFIPVILYRGKEERRLYIPRELELEEKTVKDYRNTIQVLWNEIQLGLASVSSADVLLPSSSICTCYIFFNADDMQEFAIQRAKLIDAYGDVEIIKEYFMDFFKRIMPDTEYEVINETKTTETT